MQRRRPPAFSGHRAYTQRGLQSPLILAALHALAVAQAPVQEQPNGMAALVAASCIECHLGEQRKGEVDLEGALRAGPGELDLALLRSISAELRSGRMPPRKAGKPNPNHVAEALRWIDAELARASDPGRPTLRRLNRREYENSVADLCGVRFDTQGWFPPDEVGYGFDSIGDVLSMPDVLLEKYVVAAERIASQAILVADDDNPWAVRIPDSAIVHTEKFTTRDGAWALNSYGFVGVDHAFERAGEYVLRVRAWATQAGPEPARMELKLAGAALGRIDVTAERGAPQVHELRTRIEPGKQRFSVWFVNDFYTPDEPDKKKRDRNLYVEWLEIAGPLGWMPETDFQRQLFSIETQRSAREAVEHLAERAWRRPVTASEVDRLMQVAPRGAARERLVRDALVAILASPHFLFRIERDPSTAKPGAPRALSGHELATRLSYFLWSTLPDETLRNLAAKDRLQDEQVLEAQVRRMLRDARAGEFVRNFASQWLQLRALERAAPDAARFPGFDDALRASMRAETELLFEAVLREDRPLRELLDPDFTFLDERLAAHYGFDGVTGPHMRRVPLDAAQRAVRGGVLQQASVLVVTSNPTRTSPVKRGKWVLETLLGTPPLAPQPGVDTLDESPQAVTAASLRERLSLHRAKPECAVCHDQLDGLGFALENYDPVGRWRTEADGFPVDPSGELASGIRLDGAAALERHMAANPAFVRCLAEKLAVYATGRGMRPEDAPALDALAASLEGRDATLQDLVLAVVRLDAFRRTVVAEKP